MRVSVSAESDFGGLLPCLSWPREPWSLTTSLPDRATVGRASGVTDERPGEHSRRRCGGTATLPPPTPPGPRHLEVVMRSLCSSPVHRRARLGRHPRGLGAPAPRARARHLPGRPRPQRSGPGRAARRHAVPPEETTVRVVGTATANPQAPGGVELTGATSGPDRAGRDRPSSCGGPPRRLPAHAARPRPVLWRHPAQRAKWELAAASLRGFRATLDGLGFTEMRRRSSSSRPPSPARTSSRSTTSAGRPTSPRARSSTSSSWSGVFERVYEVGPVFRAEPHDTVRHLAE